MSDKNIEVKVGGTWYFYNWEQSSGNFYKTSGGLFGKSYSKLGKAQTLQDAIGLAKAHCNADKYATVEIKN